MRLLKLVSLRALQKQAKTWQWLLLILTLLIGSLLTFYVMHSEDAEMRENLITYANTIERSIDWRPFENVLNTNPNNLTSADFNALRTQLNDACKANRDCYFIYLLYLEKGLEKGLEKDLEKTLEKTFEKASEKGLEKNNVKFLLDASPQPESEISQLAEVFVEATEPLKTAMLYKKPLVEGPVIDHWGTWVSARVPVKITLKGNHFVMLNVDVAVAGWQSRLYKKALVPVTFTLIFSGFLLWFMAKNKEREQQYTALFNSTSELVKIANNDELTGLPNRRLLEDRIAQAIKSAARTRQIVAVLFLDLDYFKAVNDTHGHLTGDLLLKLVATRLKGLLRDEDTIARIGGDEFVILLSNLNSELQAISLAEKVVKVLTEPFQVSSKSLKIGVSVGIALYREHDTNEINLIRHADNAMYTAKRQGRSCYAVYRDNLSETST